MRTTFQFLLSVFLLLGSNGLLFAQDDFYNRDSSGYTYRIGPVLPKIQQDWQLGALGRDFTFGFNPSGVNIENYVLSLLNLPDIRTALQASTATELKDAICEQVRNRVAQAAAGYSCGGAARRIFMMNQTEKA